MCSIALRCIRVNENIVPGWKEEEEEGGNGRLVAHDRRARDTWTRAILVRNTRSATTPVLRIGVDRSVLTETRRPKFEHGRMCEPSSKTIPPPPHLDRVVDRASVLTRRLISRENRVAALMRRAREAAATKSSVQKIKAVTRWIGSRGPVIIRTTTNSTRRDISLINKLEGSGVLREPRRFVFAIVYTCPP